MLAGDGEDQRQLPLSFRKTNLARLLKRRILGVFIAEYEEGEIGRDLFRVACNMDLEGIVSKHRDRAYIPGKCRHWVKTKNPSHPAYNRVRDQLLVTRSRKSRGKPLRAASPKRKVTEEVLSHSRVVDGHPLAGRIIGRRVLPEPQPGEGGSDAGSIFEVLLPMCFHFRFLGSDRVIK